MSAFEHAEVFDLAKSGLNDARIVDFLRSNPDLFTEPIGTDNWSMLQHIVFLGNVPLLKQVVDIVGIHFNLDVTGRDEKSLIEVVDAGREGANENRRAKMDEMAAYIRFLHEWDQHCNYAKHHMNTENERLWAWLRRNTTVCYKSPPSRRWSIGMQVVYTGEVTWMENLLRICPQPRRGEIIWKIRGNDGMTMRDVAREIQAHSPQMAEFVERRYQLTDGISPRPPQAETPTPAVPVEESPLTAIIAQWGPLTAAKVTRPAGICPILGAEPEPLFSPSMDCTHSFGQLGLQGYLQVGK